MEYHVKIDEFEGPLDLLLYLIKEMKISIDKVNVSEITKQYLDFIHAMESLNLEIAGEYLVMAAYLTFVKSKIMLPKAEISNEESEYEENPAEKLKMRLKIYKLFKDSVPFLRNLEEERSCYLTKIPSAIQIADKLDIKEMVASNIGIYDLLSAFNKVLKRYFLHQPIKTKIKQQTVTLEACMEELKALFTLKGTICFTELFCEKNNKEHTVLMLMSILELAKNKLVYIRQNGLYADIYVDYIAEERGA